MKNFSKGLSISRIITTDDGSQYRKAGFFRSYAGVAAGAGVQSAVILATQPVNGSLINKMGKISRCADTAEIREALNKALVDSGAAAKGTQIVDYSGVKTISTKDLIAKKMENFLGRKMKFSDLNPKKLVKKGINFVNDIMRNEIKLGHNAAFDANLNQVLINTEKRGLTGFHEIRHSLNKNASKFWRVVQKLRLPGAITAGAVGVVAIYKRKKVEGEKPKNFIDKTTDFIKNNAGKLTLLAFTPIISEEMRATVGGNKMAKKMLSPELAKKVIKSNAMGGLTYVITAGAMALGAVLASKTRDAIAKPKQVA